MSKIQKQKKWKTFKKASEKNYIEIHSNISKNPNNKTELLAILEGLKMVDSEKNVKIYSKSEYAIHGIKSNGWENDIDLFSEITTLISNRKGKTKILFS
jgi:ribonuclease HI